MGRKIFRGTKKSLVLFLDYDGTLTPIREKPSLAKIKKSTRALLKKLASKRNLKIFIISGRSLKDVKSLIRVKGLCYIGNHGIEFEGPGFRYTHPGAKKLKSTVQKCYKLFRTNLKFKGILVENKIYTLSVHYRLVRDEEARALKSEFWRIIKNLRERKKIKVTEGKKVLELRPNIKWDKGRIVKYVLKHLPASSPDVICIGDDRTDEDAFRALGKRGISILVSRKPRKTAASYRMRSPKDVFKFLKFILKTG